MSFKITSSSIVQENATYYLKQFEFQGIDDHQGIRVTVEKRFSKQACLLDFVVKQLNWNISITSSQPINFFDKA